MAAYAKAVVGAVIAGIAYLVGVVPAEGGFADLTTGQWLGLAGAVLGAFGVVWGVPNRQASDG